MAMTNKELREAVELLKQQAEQQAAISNSYDGYLKGLKDAKLLSETIAANKKIEREIQAKMLAEFRRGNRQGARDEYDKLEVLRSQNKELERQGAILGENLKQANKGNLLMAKAGASTIKTLSQVPKLVEKGYGKLKGLGLFEMDKAMKKSALSMNILSKQSDSFRDDIKMAAKDTVSMGVGIEELSAMQSDYSQELGRAVMLSKDGLKAMSSIAAATGLGAEGTSKMAADMEQQGISAERTRDFIEQTVNDAHKMGINAYKVIKNVQQNIKLLNKYNFKDGIRGLAKMAETTAKLGVDMNAFTNIADKLFDIDGAVEMSAQLQVMGGAWAKLSDPFKLMSLARNDMNGLTEEIGKAAEASVFFNKKAGDFEISAMEMHKLRKIAEQTGIAYEDLATAGKNARKQTEIRKQLNFSVDKDTQNFLTTTAKFTEGGDAYIEIKGNKQLLKTLSESDKQLLSAQVKEKQTLEERAKDSRSFDDALGNTLNLFKITLLPLIETINENLIPRIDGFVKRIKDGKWIESIEKFGTQIGSLVSFFAGWILDNPIKSAFIYGAAKLSGFLMDKALWISHGMDLATGFKIGTAGGIGQIGGNLLGQTAGGGAGMMKNFSGAAGSTMTKLGGVAAGLLTAYSEYSDNQNKGMSTSENLGRSGIKGVGAGLGAWGGAAAGATLGSLVPVVGTAIGAIIGGALGAWGGSELGDVASSSLYGDKVHDGISISPKTLDKISEESGTKRSIVAGGMIRPIDDADSFLTKKDTGPVERSFKKNSEINTIKHEFGNLNISGELIVTSPGGGSVAIDLVKDPTFIRNITRMIHSETEKVIQGGKNKG